MSNPMTVHHYPDPVSVVLLVVPVKVPYSVPTAEVVLLLVWQLVMSVLTLANIDTILPAVGADLDVSVVPVWPPIAVKVLTKLDQFVAVTVPAGDTVLIAVCPHPNPADPVPHWPLILALLVLTNPLKSVACITLPTEYAMLSHRCCNSRSSPRSSGKI